MSKPPPEDIPACQRCGEPHLTPTGRQACSGHVIYDRSTYVKGNPSARKRLDKPRGCRNNPRMAGVCAVHGAHRVAMDKAAEKAARQKERERMQQLAITLGAPVEADPAEIIIERIAARNGHVRWLLARVQALEPDALTWGLTKRKTAVARGTDEDADTAGGNVTPGRFAGTDEGDTLEAKPHIWYALYIDSARELERLCIEAIRVGLEERRVRMDEKLADRWVRVIDGVLAELGHNPNDPATAEIVARHLELVA